MGGDKTGFVLIWSWLLAEARVCGWATVQAQGHWVVPPEWDQAQEDKTEQLVSGGSSCLPPASFWSWAATCTEPLLCAKLHALHWGHRSHRAESCTQKLTVW